MVIAGFLWLSCLACLVSICRVLSHFFSSCLVLSCLVSSHLDLSCLVHVCLFVVPMSGLGLRLGFGLRFGVKSVRLRVGRKVRLRVLIRFRLGMRVRVR